MQEKTCDEGVGFQEIAGTPHGELDMNHTKNILAKDLMNKDIVRLDADDSIETAIETLARTRSAAP
jgi:CBS domain-containing protein